jgi:hypothetical protein
MVPLPHNGSNNSWIFYSDTYNGARIGYEGIGILTRGRNGTMGKNKGASAEGGLLAMT